jgi:hypothetical protein
MGCSETQSFNSLTNQSTLSMGRGDVCGTVEDFYLRLSQGGTYALVQLAMPFTLAFRSPARAISRKRRETDIDTAANRRGSFDPHAYIDATGVPRGYQTNLKPEIKLKQDLNQYSSGGPL